MWSRQDSASGARAADAPGGTLPQSARARKRMSVRSVVEGGAPLIFLGLLLAFWQIIVPVLGLSEFVLPTPFAIATRILNELPLLLPHTAYTLFEVSAGFGLSVIIGIPLALAIFYSRVVERSLYPLLIGLETVPKVVLAPLLVLYLGYGWAPKIGLAFMISFFPILIATVVGLKSLDKNFVSLSRSMGASELQTFFKIRLPAALPNIFGGLKVGIALAVVGAVIGEYIASEKGLGYLQLQATAQFDTTLNFATVFMISGVGVGLYSILRFFEQRMSYEGESAK